MNIQFRLENGKEAVVRRLAVEQAAVQHLYLLTDSECVPRMQL